MKRLRSMPDDTKKIQPAEKLSFLRYFAQVFVSKMKHSSFSLLSTKPGIICISSPQLFLRLPSSSLSLSFSLSAFFSSLLSSFLSLSDPYSLYERVSRSSNFAPVFAILNWSTRWKVDTLQVNEGAALIFFAKDRSLAFRKFKGMTIGEGRRYE